MGSTADGAPLFYPSVCEKKRGSPGKSRRQSSRGSGRREELKRATCAPALGLEGGCWWAAQDSTVTADLEKPVGMTPSEFISLRMLPM